MNQDGFDAILMGTDDEFLPDGWDGKTDIFLENGQLNEAAFASDGEQAAETLPEENEDVADESADVPATDEEAQDVQPDQDADEETEEAPADGQEQAEVKPSRKVKLRINHKDEEIDIDAMSDAELKDALEKSRAFDRMKDAENKRKFREVYQEQVDAGMTDAVAKVVAQAAADGKAYDLEDASGEEASDEAEETAAPARDFVAEVAQLRALYPDFQETPDEVARAVAQGIPLLSAYLAYRDKQSTQTAAALKRENAKLKQDAATAAKAPVKGVTGGGKATPPKKDPFEEGFDEALIGW